MKSLIQHTIYIILTAILLIGPQSLSSQSIGLHVDPAHNVLFGNSLAGTGNKLLWLPGQGAFRAGNPDGDLWDVDTVGLHSAAFGRSTLASGQESMAWGFNNNAVGRFATAFGNGARAFGSGATAFGSSTQAIGHQSTSFGQNNYATGEASTTWGGGSSIEFVNGVPVFTPIQNNAKGNFSTVWGKRNIATSYNETLLGRFADTTQTNDPQVWDESHQLFAIGNGQDEDNRNNALTILKSGHLGLDESTPEALLHVADRGNVLFGDSLQGPGSRLLWVSEKSALRAGELVDNGSPKGKNWDLDSIGNRSVAFGYNNLVKGEMGMAWGESNSVSSVYGTVWGSYNTSVKSSTVWGFRNNADGTDATVWGIDNTINGQRITAWGRENKASGLTSTVWGRGNDAQSQYETLLGRYAEISNTPNGFNWEDDDQLFAIGNGTSTSNRNNALTILKNGNIGINTSSPRGSFDVKTTNGNVYLTDDTNGDVDNNSGSLYLPGHIFIAPFKNNTNIAYLQARRENTSGSTQLNIRTTQNGVISEAVQIKSDGDVDIKGFVKIGDTAPAVKYKTITLDTPDSPGFYSSENHGLDQTKIIGMQASLVDGINTLFPNDRISSWRYNVRITDTQVRIEIESGSTITDTPVTVTLTYVE